MLVSIDFNNFHFQSNENLGAIEIGTFLGLILFGILLGQTYSYFGRFTKDRFALRLLVSILVVLELVHTLLLAASIYYDTVTTWQAPRTNTYTLSTATFFENLITIIVQLCFAHRIHRLSSPGRLSITALVCAVLAVLRFVGAFAVGVEGILDVAHDGGTGVFVVRVSWLITATLSVGAAADVLIAASMIYYLRQLSSPTQLRRTTDILNRLTRWTVQTGLLTSLAHVAAILCFQTIGNLVWLAIYIVLAKLYSNSLLMILNARPGSGPLTLNEATSIDFGGTTSGTRTVTTVQLSHLHHDTSQIQVDVTVDKA
ncbi:hypothetical protein NLJ89_g8638 [Agrocybe chaxingu]|uniref:DUF6534 domain-containing protein n=1 Tax=Agrocybe chaxingu TaxID=84603 RepID=A0A9W8K1G4_9AGAR|nr:hypothetical protein NLJ89_g8638 [Agrocybe chaxingu]